MTHLEWYEVFLQRQKKNFKNWSTGDASRDKKRNNYYDKLSKRKATTIAVVEGQCCEQDCTEYL